MDEDANSTLLFEISLSVLNMQEALLGDHETLENEVSDQTGKTLNSITTCAIRPLRAIVPLFSRFPLLAVSGNNYYR